MIRSQSGSVIGNGSPHVSENLVEFWIKLILKNKNKKEEKLFKTQNNSNSIQLP